MEMFYYTRYKNFLIRKIFDLITLFFKPEKNSLEKMLSYCSKNIGFYRGMGDSLDNYPIIDKNVLRNDFDRFVNRKALIKNVGITSGTTGTPGKYYRDIPSMAAEQYYQNMYFKWNGTYRVIFRGEKLFEPDYKSDKIYRTVPLINEMLVSSYHINDRTLKNLVEKLKTIKGRKSLWAYPSSAYALAEYCLKNNERLEFDVVALSSEVLMDRSREVIEKAFRCRVKDWYGQAERVAALVRCEAGHYHELKGYSHIEYLPVRDNTYEIVGTTLHNKIMPLVRFNMHDLVETSQEPCPCGARGWNIVKIHGRSSDYIELHGRRLAEAALTNLFKGMENITEAQVIQKKDKRILIRVVRSENFDGENEKLLISHISGIIPRELFTLEYVERIERDARGKFRHIINEGTLQQ